MFKLGVVVHICNPNILKTRYKDQMFKTAWAMMQDPGGGGGRAEMVSKCCRETIDQIQMDS